MGSRRLPGKVMMQLGGQPALEHVVKRASRANRLEQLVVATTNLAEDDLVEAWCTAAGIRCFRGDSDDVLRRYYLAAREFKADPIVRLTADCPLLDPDVIDLTIDAFNPEKHDYVSNAMPPSFPNGVELEVFSFEALACSHRMARRPSEREHVTSFILNNPEYFRLHNVSHRIDLSSCRWTLDEACDREFLDKVMTLLGEKEGRLPEVLEVLRQHPELSRINESIDRDEGYAKSLRDERSAGAGQELYRRAQRRIPGAAQHVLKGPDAHLPEQWPSYYSRAKGCEVWDLEGRRYLDFGLGALGACMLGFADDDVDDAVRRAVGRGASAPLLCPEEMELADLLCEVHPWADMVRLARGGEDAMAVAVRIARAATGRERVAVCGYHGWHDWSLAANLAGDGRSSPAGRDTLGVPSRLAGTAVSFGWNCADELLAIAGAAGPPLAAIVIAPVTWSLPEPEFLCAIREACRRSGAVLIANEMTMGFRLCEGGSHLCFELQPDIAVFARGLSNGYAMGALVGRAAVMEAARDCFVGSACWTERIGPAAAIATVQKLIREKASLRLAAAGRQVRAGWIEAAKTADIPISIAGADPLLRFDFLIPEALPASTLFTQWMLDRGFLADTAFCPSLAHEDGQISHYLDAVADVFRAVAAAVLHGRIHDQIHGPLAALHPAAAISPLF